MPEPSANLSTSSFSSGKEPIVSAYILNRRSVLSTTSGSVSSVLRNVIVNPVSEFDPSETIMTSASLVEEFPGPI